MDEGLFSKHLRSIKKRDTEKQMVITSIFTAIGVQLEESDIIISKKTVILSVSSTKRAILTQKGLTGALEAIGYNLG